MFLVLLGAVDRITGHAPSRMAQVNRHDKSALVWFGWAWVIVLRAERRAPHLCCYIRWVVMVIVCLQLNHEVISA